MQISEKDLPYKIEYAISGRAKCKACQIPIGQGLIRLAVMVQSSYAKDAKQASWFHEHCFFNKQRPESEGDIANFSNISLNDQKKIRKKIAELGPGIVLPKLGKGKKRSREENGILNDFGIEYARSSRSICRGCEQIITKGDIRIRKTVFDTEVGAKYGGQALWHHVECFAQCRNNLSFLESGDLLPGFKDIFKVDQKSVKEKLPKMKQGGFQDIKKVKLEPTEEVHKIKDEEFDKKLEIQQNKFFKYYEIASKVLNKNDCNNLLIHNKQNPAKNDTGGLYNQVADMLAFGALKSCSVCKKGQFYFNKTGYLCSGNLNEWKKCANYVKEPERFQCEIQDYIKEQYKKLEKYNQKPTVRLIKYVAPSVSTISKLIKKEANISVGPKVKRERPPLYNFKVVIIGLKNKEVEIKTEIQKLGGSITKSINEKTTIIISDKNEVKKMGKKMLIAKELEIPVVSEDYLTMVKEDHAAAISNISSKILWDWSTDPYTRLSQEEQFKSDIKLKTIYTKSVPKSVKLKFKLGLAVEPELGLEDNAHIYKKDDGLTQLIDIEHGNDETERLDVDHHFKSKLPKHVQDLIKLIFDVDVMKQVMLEFNLDMEKMALENLSQKQIHNAYKILTELSNLIIDGALEAQFIDATNRYYTLIPHNFGMDNPPLLDTIEQIKHQTYTLDSLVEIEFAYNLIKGEKDSETNPVDKYYEQFNTELKPVDKNTKEFKQICRYVENTKAETLYRYELQILEVFKVVRKIESHRYKPFRKLHNRKLLWFGSRLTNFVGILSHGLKIAPPEAPVTGYMFGKGISFADIVSKAANSCCTSKQKNIGLMLLSEVALGDMHETPQSKNIILPKDKHSVKVIGRTQPNPKESVFREDGVEIPLGKCIQDKKNNLSLLYNEFIVYNAAQVNIQYLLKMKFNYKY